MDILPVLADLDKLEFENSGGVCAWVTRKGSVAPKSLMDLVSSLNLGGTTQRLFCRKLMPHQNIDLHVDDHDWMKECRRFQIPLVSDPEIRMRWPDDDVDVYLEPGWLYEVRVDRPHEVINNADIERIHIQIDQRNATFKETH